MTIITPDTGSLQYFRVRTMPSASLSSFRVRLALTNEETNVPTSITNVTASYDAYDFLCVTASLNLQANNFFTMDIVQLSGSTDCTVLYRGEILPTTQSATVRNSDPMLSYIDNSNEFIIYEY
jgi:hypothetical protein